MDKYKFAAAAAPSMALPISGIIALIDIALPIIKDLVAKCKGPTPAPTPVALGSDDILDELTLLHSKKGKDRVPPEVFRGWKRAGLVDNKKEAATNWKNLVINGFVYRDSAGDWAVTNDNTDE